MRRVVVVGCGMVGYRFVRELRARDADSSITIVGEEPRPAYDRVRLTTWFAHKSADALSLAPEEWYRQARVSRREGVRATAIDRRAKRVVLADGERLAYDVLVLATGSSAFVPPIPGTEKRGVFVYRTIEDLEAIAAYTADARHVAVIGGGLLGLEAARAMLDASLDVTVLEATPRLMPRQLDAPASALLERTVRDLGVRVRVGATIQSIEGETRAEAILLDGERLDVDAVVISAGIRPRDELARASGIDLGPRGGVVVDDAMQTSDPSVFAIGEVALHAGVLYGLVAPGYEMAEVLARHLTGERASFGGSDHSAKLKLLGTDVASFGDPEARGARAIAWEDQLRGTYKKLVLSEDGRRLLGGILVGDASDYARLLHLARTGAPISESRSELSPSAESRLPDVAQICSCNDVCAGAIREAVRGGKETIAEIKACTRAGTGCGGCLPLVTDLVDEARGQTGPRHLCEHFAFSRQDLYAIVRAAGVRTFDALLASHGRGSGCEICKPAVASILASAWGAPILEQPTVQDSNDRFLANIQKDGTYSVIPRVPAGEITADQLVALGVVAKKYALYTKITGGQRVDLLGARLDDLPAIWEELAAAGFESGHAYGKAMRTVKSCVGSTWCRYGVQDSTSFAKRIEHRYKGIRAPHKLKCAVSGCVRECAEAQSKDFGLIATERGWNVYVCGNGGAKPRHAEILVTDVDEDTAIRLLDRFVMFYIRTADRLTRTSVWLDKMEGGIERLRDVVVRDALGIGETLEREMQVLVDAYECEWANVLSDPKKRASFRSALAPKRHLHVLADRWVRLASASDVPSDGGIAVKYGPAEIALFHFASRGEWYAVDNACPHTGANVLARGILGDAAGLPKVACPLHKKTFELRSGTGLSDDDLAVTSYPVRVEGDDVFVELPPAEQIVTRCERACAPKALAS